MWSAAAVVGGLDTDACMLIMREVAQQDFRLCLLIIAYILLILHYT